MHNGYAWLEDSVALIVQHTLNSHCKILWKYTAFHTNGGMGPRTFPLPRSPHSSLSLLTSRVPFNSSWSVCGPWIDRWPCLLSRPLMLAFQDLQYYSKNNRSLLSLCNMFLTRNSSLCKIVYDAAQYLIKEIDSYLKKKNCNCCICICIFLKVSLFLTRMSEKKKILLKE